MTLSFLKPQAIMAVAVGVMLTALLSGCDHVDFDRVPPSNVRLSFDTRAEWDRYGTPGALDHKRFILDGNLRVPSDFPWTALTYTGYGGILLVGDVNGAPYAYDLCCPVELRRDIRIEIDPETNEAYCPSCGSRYSVYTNYGSPISGEARKLKRGLRRFNVGPGINGEFMVVSR
ncbi:MAG: hypothetical protein K2L97_06810 [Muribaculaceae bacterium]|nr:hypothetical protein [Muribaculaceae bacterium]